MKNTLLGFNSYEVSDYECEVSDMIARAFGMYPYSNLRYKYNDSSAGDGLVYSIQHCALINYKPCFDPSMKHDPKRFTDGVHNTLLAFSERFPAHWQVLDADHFVLVFEQQDDDYTDYMRK